MNKTLEKLIETGIPVTAAHFHAAVNNANKVPQTYFSQHSDVHERRVNMWYTQYGLVCHQKTAKTKEDRYFIVPLPTLIFANFGINATTKEAEFPIKVETLTTVSEPQAVKKTRRAKSKVEIE